MSGFLGAWWRRLGFALLGAGLGWVALFSWTGLLEQAPRLLSPALYGAVIIAVLGAALRARRLRWYLVLVIQLVVLVSWLQYRTRTGSGPSGLIPTPTGLRAWIDTLHHGAGEVNKYASPIGFAHVDAVEYLLALGLVVILAVDLLAAGMRRAAWAGLPVVIALAVPVSVLDAGLNWLVFIGCALLFVLLLAADEARRVRSWARKSEVISPAGDANDYPAPTDSVRGAAAGIGTVATIGALLLPLLVPVSSGLLGHGHGFGPGHGGGGPVTLVNPLVDLHRDLVEGNDVPLLIASTGDRNRDYLRLTVLDQFDGVNWKPSKRLLPSANRVAGALPPAPGVNPDSPGPISTWRMQLTPAFQTSWLPAPYPLVSLVTSAGDWRFDSRTLDYVRVDSEPGAGYLRYQAQAAHPTILAGDLETAAPAPQALQGPMTALPPNISPIVARTAARVTAGALTTYAQMVKLQDWFRTDGGFTYSLAPDSGSTSGALVRFITTDRIGYCEQFAAAMAIMARSLGVPARVVIGFLKPSGITGNQLAYSSNSLHAWPEVYFEGSGWVRFEPTPGTRSGAAPTWTQPQQIVPAPAPSATPSSIPLPNPINRRPVVPDAATTTRRTAEDPAGRIAVIAVLLAVGIAAAIPGLLRRRARRRRLGPVAGTARDLVAAGMWTELLATAIDLGVVLPRASSMRVIVEVLLRTAVPEVADRARLQALVLRLEADRFGPPGPASSEQIAAAREDVRRWCVVLAGSSKLRRRVSARLVPRSILVPGTLDVRISPAAAEVGAGQAR